MIVPFLHPRDAQLTELALANLPVENSAVARHVAACARCQQFVQSIRSMRDSLLATPPLEADAEQLTRILERRAAGERVMLADSFASSAPESRSRTRVIGALVATGAIAATVVVWSNSKPARPAEGIVAGAPDTLPPPPATESPLSFLAPWPNVAHAATAPRDTVVQFAPLRASAHSLGTPGGRTFVRSSASSYSGYRPIGAISVGFTDTTWRKERVWRVVTTEPLVGRFGRNDTAWIRQSDLKLLMRRSRSHGSLLTQRAVGDTLLEQTFEISLRETGYRGKVNPKALKSTWSRRVDPSRLLITDLSSFMLLMRSQPLHRGWRGSIDVNTSKLSPSVLTEPATVNVSVEGDSIVNTLWGYVPSWRVVVHTGINPERWYVSKEGREVLLVTGPNGMAWPRSRLDLMGRFLK